MQSAALSLSVYPGNTALLDKPHTGDGINLHHREIFSAAFISWKKFHTEGNKDTFNAKETG